MDKKILAFLCIATIIIISGIVIGLLYYNSDSFVFPEGSTYRGVTPVQPDKVISRVEHSPNNAFAEKLIAGICALFLVGYLFVFFYLMFKRDSKADSVALENFLHKISLESGRTEYELFIIAAKEWSIAEARIDEDFKNFMAANILPYYVMDFVRKNHDYIDESLRKEEEIGPTTLWDFIRALLIFPGCLLVPIFLGIIFGHNILKW